MGYYNKEDLDMQGKWNLDVRLSGLDGILGEVKGHTIIDLGMAEGLISLEAAKRGAKSIHGFEVESSRVEKAQELFINETHKCNDYYLGQADLNNWNLFRNKYKEILLEDYNIVFFLGIYHHLGKLSRKPSLEGALELSNKFFAIRTPIHFKEEVIATVDNFRTYKQIHELNPHDGAGWLGIFERNY